MKWVCGFCWVKFRPTSNTFIMQGSKEVKKEKKRDEFGFPEEIIHEKHVSSGLEWQLLTMGFLNKFHFFPTGIFFFFR